MVRFVEGWQYQWQQQGACAKQCCPAVKPETAACRMLDNTGKEKEGILYLEPQSGSRPLNPGCLDRTQDRKKILGS
jgi:hypothetical protein